ncbi:nuclear receptor coactivator 7 isoform X2 [Narcine bancroftii]|uniref:nuclear receptor coactivator 7 isoform X2 n=1 Tax=Narcine bancroftii TaxID=1343680 RepID=UPI003831DC90
MQQDVECKQTKVTTVKSLGMDHKKEQDGLLDEQSNRAKCCTFPSGRQKTVLQQIHSIENNKTENNGITLFQGKTEGTIEYRVRVEDTLSSIALKFNSTPNKLVNLNKLYSQTIVPGQRLYIPYPASAQGDNSPLSLSPNQSSSLSSSDAEYDKLLDADSAEMSRVQWCSSHYIISSSCPIRDEIPTSERFLKICCKYFTDRKGVIIGILFVTPKKIFFDPYKSHPLIIEHGCEDYFFACSTKSIISAESHKDISQMKLYTSSPLRKVPVQSKIKQTRGNTAISSQKKNLYIITAAQIKGKMHSAEIKENNSFPANQEAKTLTKCTGIHNFCPYSVCQVNVKPLNEIMELKNKIMHLKLKENDKLENEEIFPFTSRIKYKEDDIMSENKRHYCSAKSTGKIILEPKTNYNGSQHLSHILTENHLCKENKGETTCNSLNNTDNKTASFCEINLSDQRCKYPWSQMMENTRGALLYTELSSMKAEDFCYKVNNPKDDQCGLCGKQDNEASSTLMRRSGFNPDLHHSEDDEDKFRLIFLCLKVKLPVKKKHLPKFGDAATQDSDQNKSEEYWFAMSQEKVTEFHTYLKHWRPDIYLFEGMGDTCVDDFVLLNGKCPFSLNEKLFDKLFDDWEIITKDDPLRHHKDAFDPEFGNVAPVLQGKSCLMESSHIEKISQCLPPRTVGHPWRLAFSTSSHGFSLKSLYRKVADIDSPVLLVVKDTCGQLFGALTSHPPKPSDYYYGTGETFLYTFNLDFKIFQWTGENSFFIKGSLDSLALGGGSGHFGLWLDEDLNHGRSNPCTTFNNSILSKTEDFMVQDLEVWTFR